MNFEHRIGNIVQRKLGLEKFEAESESSFVTKYGKESPRILELVLALEEEFDVDILNEDIAQLHTISDVVDCVFHKKLGL